MVEVIGIVSLILVRLRVIYPIPHAILIATKVERITHASRQLRLETEPTRPSIMWCLLQPQSKRDLPYRACVQTETRSADPPPRKPKFG